MSNEKKETIADIVAEMRNGPCCWLTPAGIPQHSHDNELFYKFADRIEAAAKREMETSVSICPTCLQRWPRKRDEGREVQMFST